MRLLFAGIILLAGCAHERQYYAAELPPQYLAQPTSNAQTLDLSRLAVAAPKNNIIDKGDVIEVTIASGIESEVARTIPVRVTETGNAHLPVLGDVQLAGLELEGAEQAIATACEFRGLYRQPHVTVTMKQQATNRITVLGAVMKPGTYSLPRGTSDLLTAIVAAGGLAEDAGTDVEIRQPKTPGVLPEPGRLAGAPNAEGLASGHSQTAGDLPAPAERGMQSIKIDLVSAAKEGRGGTGIPDGGVVMVQRRDQPPVQIIGLVRKPGQYEFPPGHDMHVLSALALASGVSNPFADKIIVSRRDPLSNDPVVIEVSIKEAKRRGDVNVRLAPGDVVSVEQTPTTIFIDALGWIRFSVGTSVTPFL